MSQSCDLTLRLPADLHARPAGQMAQAAARFDASVTVGAGEREANARSVLAVMSLGATADSVVTLHATGPEAAQAVHALALLLGEMGPVETQPSR